MADRRHIALGFSQTAVAAATTTSVTVRTQVELDPDELRVATPQYFKIVDIRIGNESQFGAAGEIAGTSFPEQNTPQFHMDHARAGTDITLQVRNTDAAAHDFAASLWGWTEYQ